MQLLIATLAEAANVAKGGNLNIHGAFSGIRAPRFPAVMAAMVLVLRFHLEHEDAGDHRLTIVLVDMDGKELLRATKEFTVERIPAGAHHYIDEHLQLVGVGFKSPGQFSFRVQWDDQEPTRVRLDVTQASEQPGPGA